MKKVSIIIPLYNCELYIAETIKSALSQTWPNIEIIIIDDGSKDNSFKIAKSFESDIVKIHQQNNKGASSARNKGFQLSKGDYIQYLDADDLLSPNKIEAQIKLFELYGDNIITTCQWGRFYDTISNAKFKRQIIDKDYQNPLEWLIDSWNGKGMAAQHSWLIPRNLIKKAGPWNESITLNDDGEFFCRILIQSQSIRFCTTSQVYYRSGIQNSLSQDISETKAKSLLLSYKLYEDNILQKEDSPILRQALLLNYSSFVYIYYPKFPQLIDLAKVYAKKLGFKSLKPTGGNTFKILSFLLGFENTLKLKSLLKKNNN